MLYRNIKKNLSLRISLMVVYGLTLLTATLVVMFHFAHKALKEEAMSHAEQTLEATVLQIDNILLSVEQTTGNVYFNLIKHLDEPERMETYCRELVESNPYVKGCAIVFRPHYFADRDLFMAYVRRNGPNGSPELAVRYSYTDKPYTVQRWYTEPMEEKYPLWIDPLKNEEAEGEAITTFCLPFKDASGEYAGVLAVDLSIGQLSKIILSVKPSPNGYAMMLARNGSFIVHPDERKLTQQTVFEQLYEGADYSVMEVAEAMVSGQKGQKSVSMRGQQWRVFYKPLKRTEVKGRAQTRPGWSVGVVYPIDDIYGPYNRLFWYLLSVSALAILILFVLCWLVIRRQLAPMEILTHSAQRVAEGHYDEPLPEMHRNDEIGRMEKNFRKIQQLHADYLEKQRQMNARQQERGKVLAEAYDNVRKANSVKTTFLHHMTNQMVEPAASIDRNVKALCDDFQTLTAEEIILGFDVIKQQSDTIMGLTNQLLQTAQDETRKEVTHE